MVLFHRFSCTFNVASLQYYYYKACSSLVKLHLYSQIEQIIDRLQSDFGYIGTCCPAHKLVKCHPWEAFVRGFSNFFFSDFMKT